VLLLSIFFLAGPGEHSIQPTLWDASPGVVRSPACQASLPFWFFSCTHSLTLYFCSLSQEYILQGGRDSKPQIVRLINTMAYASRATREVGAALEARRLIRPSHAPVWRTAGLLLEREQEIFHARRDRASGRTLVGRHAGSMPPS
jgi:hypothetical protein